MTYTKTNWTSTTPINTTNLNKLESGIEQNSNDIEQINNNIGQVNSDIEGIRNDIENISGSIGTTETNSITIGFTDYKTISLKAWTDVITPFDAVKTKAGDKLTFSGNRIHIGSGINYILLSASIEFTFTGTSTGYTLFTIRKNDSTDYVASRNVKFDSNTEEYSIFTPVLIPVSEGDNIKIDVASSMDGTIKMTGLKNSWLTVVAI